MRREENASGGGDESAAVVDPPAPIVFFSSNILTLFVLKNLVLNALLLPSTKFEQAGKTSKRNGKNDSNSCDRGFECVVRSLALTV